VASRRVASQPLLAGLQKFLRPSVMVVLVDSFFATKLSNADLTAKALQHNADLLFH
jgi:hypothetical protein